jgi:alpha-D-ribose 1-methylphosphonate 5-triphosphate synthase subunit PhnH
MGDTATAAADRPRLGPGFADPVMDAQTVFRAALTAMSEPGRILAVPSTIHPPAGLPRAAVALLLTLVDFETPLWLPPALSAAAVGGYLRFHTGAPTAADPMAAQFAAVDWTGPNLIHQRVPLAAFNAGDERYPDKSATLIVCVAGLDGGTLRVRLSGPGIDGARSVAPAGLDQGFWAEVQANHAGYPLGIDLILAAGDAMMALPRSTRVEIG